MRRKEPWFDRRSCYTIISQRIESCSVMSDYLRPHVLYTPWNSPGQNTGVGSLSLLQGIFPTQGWNPGLPHFRWILYQLSQKGSPRILEWVAYPFCSRSFRPRNQTGVSCIAGGFFTNWAIRDGYLLPENKFTHILSPVLQQNQPTGTGPLNSKCLGLQL